MINMKKEQASSWFKSLQSRICAEFEAIEKEFSKDDSSKFTFTDWDRSEGGGGKMSLMRGNVFEKVGVNFSAVTGKFNEEMQKKIPGSEGNPNFFATGISLVAHMHSPLVPAVHMNTRFIVTEKEWFGGGADLNPAAENIADTKFFHQQYKECCDRHNPDYYEKYKKWCDEYFFIKHRNQSRGVGGIFYDYLNSGSFSDDFDFSKDVGETFLKVYSEIVRNHMYKDYSEEQKEVQLRRRGLYAEFNLLYDRGTKFGLETNGNVDAILMSLPPEAKW